MSSSYLTRDRTTSRSSAHNYHYAPASLLTAAPLARPSMSSESQFSTQYATSNYGDRRRSTRPRRDSEGQSITSHTSRRTNQTNQTGQTGRRSRRRERPPTPPPKDLPSLLPAMTADEDNRSEIRALRNRFTGYIKRIARVFKPHRSKSPLEYDSSEYTSYTPTPTSPYPYSPNPAYDGASYIDTRY